MREHQRRIIYLFIVFIIVFMAVRTQLVPESFGEYGWYRGESVDEIMNLPVKHAGSQSCSECHQPEFNAWQEGRHKTVSCETCHGPLNWHVKKPYGASIETNSTKEFCGICHSINPSRPADFPQVDMIVHGYGLQCVYCHNPHDPWFD